MIGIAVTAGAIVGALIALLTRNIYVPILVPLTMGAALGAACGYFVHYWSVRNLWVVGVATVLGWMVCMSVFHWVEYRNGFVGAISVAHNQARASDGAPALTPEQAIQAGDIVLDSLVGEGGFYGFLKLRVRAGMRMRGFGQPTLGAPWAIGVWLLDLFVVLLLAIKIGLGVARSNPV
jgi:hypothetical protein